MPYRNGNLCGGDSLQGARNNHKSQDDDFEVESSLRERRATWLQSSKDKHGKQGGQLV